MKTFAALAVVVTLTGAVTSAAAERNAATQPAQHGKGYLGVGMTLGVHRSFKSGMFVDGAKRMGTSAVFVRGQLTGGSSGDDTGSFTQMRVGIETRTCTAGRLVCAFAGTDVGYQRDNISNDKEGLGLMDIDAHDAILVPRAGLEVGTKIRLRTAIEAPLYQRLDASEAHYSDRSGAGLGLSLAIAGVF